MQYRLVIGSMWREVLVHCVHPVHTSADPRFYLPCPSKSLPSIPSFHPFVTFIYHHIHIPSPFTSSSSYQRGSIRFISWTWRSPQYSGDPLPPSPFHLTFSSLILLPRRLGITHSSSSSFILILIHIPLSYTYTQSTATRALCPSYKHMTNCNSPKFLGTTSCSPSCATDSAYSFVRSFIIQSWAISSTIWT